jgi:hypothetical protein
VIKSNYRNFNCYDIHETVKFDAVPSQSGFVSKLVVVVLDSGEIFFAMKQFFYL